MNPSQVLLWITRAGVISVALVPLLYAGWPGWLDRLLPPMFYPAITLRSIAFRAVVQLIVPAWLVLAVLDSRYRPRLSPTTVALLVFATAVGLADALGADPHRSLWSNYERMEGWLGLLHLTAFYLVAGAVLDSPRHWRTLALVSLGVAAIVALVAVSQWLGFVVGLHLPGWLVELHSAPDDPRYFRADACVGSPLYLAVYLLFHAFLAVQCALHASGRLARVAGGGAALLFAFGIYLTGTRIALIALPVGGLVAVCSAVAAGTRPRRRVAWIGVLLLAAVALLVALWALSPSFLDQVPGLERLRFALQAYGRRTLLWQQALEGVLERPAGWGQENFGLIFDARYDPELYLEAHWYDQPHNVFLGWFVAGGVLGGAAYLVTMAMPFFWLWSKRTPWLGLADRSVASGMLVAYAFYACFQLDGLVSYLAFFAVLAWLDAARREPRPIAAAPPRPVVAAVAVGAAAVAWAALTQLTLPAWRGAVALDALYTASARAQEVARGRLPANAVEDARALGIAERALAQAGFGTTEAREQLAQLAVAMHGNQRFAPEVRQRLLDLAIRELLAEVTERPRTARALLLAAHVLSLANRDHKARELIEAAHAMAPGKPLIVYELADVKLRTGKVEEALALVRRLHEQQPRDREAALAYALVALRAGRPDLAEPVVARLHPEHTTERRAWPDSRLVQALVAARQFDWLERIYAPLAAEAEALLQEGRIDRRQVARRYTLLAQSQVDGGKLAPAIAALERAIGHDPEFAPRGRALIAELRRRLPASSGK